MSGGANATDTNAATTTTSSTTASMPRLSVTDVNAKLTPALLYTSLMMLMAASGNALVCYVYGFRWRVTVTKTFIVCLAGLDLANSLLCMPTELAMLVRIVDFDAPVWCRVSRFLTYTLNGASSLILVSIALDRWYKVCWGGGGWRICDVCVGVDWGGGERVVGGSFFVCVGVCVWGVDGVCVSCGARGGGGEGVCVGPTRCCACPRSWPCWSGSSTSTPRSGAGYRGS